MLAILDHVLGDSFTCASSDRVRYFPVHRQMTPVEIQTVTLSVVSGEGETSCIPVAVVSIEILAWVLAATLDWSSRINQSSSTPVDTLGARGFVAIIFGFIRGSNVKAERPTNTIWQQSRRFNGIAECAAPILPGSRLGFGVGTSFHLSPGILPGEVFPRHVHRSSSIVANAKVSLGRTMGLDRSFRFWLRISVATLVVIGSFVILLIVLLILRNALQYSHFFLDVLRDALVALLLVLVFVVLVLTRLIQLLLRKYLPFPLSLDLQKVRTLASHFLHDFLSLQVRLGFLGLWWFDLTTLPHLARHGLVFANLRRDVETNRFLLLAITALLCSHCPFTPPLLPNPALTQQGVLSTRGHPWRDETQLLQQGPLPLLWDRRTSCVGCPHGGFDTRHILRNPITILLGTNLLGAFHHSNFSNRINLFIDRRSRNILVLPISETLLNTLQHRFLWIGGLVSTTNHKKT